MRPTASLLQQDGDDGTALLASVSVLFDIRISWSFVVFSVVDVQEANSTDRNGRKGKKEERKLRPQLGTDSAIHSFI